MHLERSPEHQLHGIENQRIPKTYFGFASNPRVLRPQATDQNQIQVKFTRFLCALTHTGVHFAFSIKVRDGNLMKKAKREVAKKYGWSKNKVGSSRALENFSRAIADKFKGVWSRRPKEDRS